MENYEYLWEMGNINFEYGDYDIAVQCLVQCYELSDVYRDAITEALYSCFIEPNRDEFNSSFEKYKDSSCRCGFEFIPVSDSKYYVYDVENKKFPFVLDTDSLKRKRKKDARSLFITGEYGVEKMLDIIMRTEWGGLYIYDDDKDIFLNSLYKLPAWIDYIEERVTIFKNEAEIREYFLNNNDKNIPLILGENKEHFKKIFDDIYAARISRPERLANPILTICIPTYNRGKTTYKNIKRLLEFRLTSEIEFLVSDNGSDKETEYYEKIGQIKDSRLVYSKSEQNLQYFGNIIRCIEKARGRYILFTSDEDTIYEENVYNLINLMINNPDCAAFNYGAAFVKHEAGDDAIKWSGENNYLSGITFDAKKLEGKKCVELLRSYEDNFYCYIYPHEALMIMLGKDYNLYETDICMIDKGEEDDYIAGIDGETEMLGYATYDSRVKQLDQYMKFIYSLDMSADVKARSMLNYYQRTLGMLLFASQTYSDRMCYFDICFSIYSHVMEKIRSHAEGYALLDFEQAKKIAGDMTMQFFADGIDVGSLDNMLQKLNLKVEEYDEASGYRYSDFLKGKLE